MVGPLGLGVWVRLEVRIDFVGLTEQGCAQFGVRKPTPI